MRKVIIVTVPIRMEVTSRRDILPQVIDDLRAMNDIVDMSELETQPKIFTEDIDDSVILESDEEL